MDLEQIIKILIQILLVSVPLIAAALGGMFSEKSGITNIAIEGIMTFGAFLGTVSILFFEKILNMTGILPLTLGLIFGIIGGVIFAYIHATLTVKLKIDHIISGTIVNILALALAITLTKTIYGTASTPFKNSFSQSIFEIPLLVWLILILIPITNYVMNQTKFGLQIKATGENELAAKTVGINVEKIRYQAILISGILGGISGISLVILFSGNFSAATISGKGFIALAVLIFGRHTPYGILFAGLLFGFLSSLGIVSNILFPNLTSVSLILSIIMLVISLVLIVLIKKTIFRIICSTFIYLLLLVIIFTDQTIPSIYYDILPYLMTIISLIYYSKNKNYQ